jgi:protocatechuate 3,4-dioxygenase beta subunit
MISGSVVDEDGRPVRGARVFIAEAPGFVADIAILTGDDGRFDLAAPADGHYVIASAGESGASARADVTVVGDTAGVVLEIAER